MHAVLLKMSSQICLILRIVKYYA